MVFNLFSISIKVVGFIMEFLSIFCFVGTFVPLSSSTLCPDCTYLLRVIPTLFILLSNVLLPLPPSSNLFLLSYSPSKFHPYPNIYIHIKTSKMQCIYEKEHVVFVLLSLSKLDIISRSTNFPANFIVSLFLTVT